MKLFSRFAFNPDVTQLIYALFVIILVPSVLAINTVYILRSVQRDTDFELNNKALLVESLIGLHIHDKLSDSTKLQQILNKIIKDLPEIRAIEVFKSSDNSDASFSSTSDATKKVADPVLNQLAWATNQAYSKQINATVGSGLKERLWLVASPIYDDSGKKIGVLNVYISAAQIDLITNRTIRDSLFVLVGTMIIVILLLLNHFRFFEASLILKKLKEVDQLKDDFISVASHELRTPITVINGFVYLLLKNPAFANDEKAATHLKSISDNTNRLSLLVNDLLDVSRIEQNRLKFTLVDIDIVEIITNIVNELTPSAQNKGIRLKYVALDRPLIVNCDKDRMHQVFNNLINNAIKYTLQGEVTIHHEVKDNYLKTFVKDTGVGISQEHMNKMFTKFSRIPNEKTKDVQGTGLGLWITKQLVEKMGGKIGVESIENQGSLFITTFPLH